jgi:hypothetical protein
LYVIFLQENEEEEEEEEEDDLEAALFGKKPNKVDLQKKIEQGKKAKQEARAAKQAKAEAPKADESSKIADPKTEVALEMDGDAIVGMFDEEAAAVQPVVKPEV